MYAEFIKSLGIPVRERGKNVGRDFINICCPLCHETRFHLGFHRTEGWWKCFVCGEGGQWGYRALEVLAKAANLSLSRIRVLFTEFLASQPLSAPPTQAPPQQDFFTPLLQAFLKAPSSLTPAHQTFLSQRRIFLDRLQAFGWQLPRSLPKGLAFLDVDLLVLRTAQGWRSYSPQNVPRLFGRFSPPSAQFIVLVEGVFDAVHFPAGTAYAYLTSFPTVSAINWLAKNVGVGIPVIWWPDRDVLQPAKAKQFLRTASLLNSVFDRIIIFPWDCLSDLPAKDPDEVAYQLGYEVPYQLAQELIREV